METTPPRTMRDHVDLHSLTYREAARRQHERAQMFLAASDYSATATACHRALQYTRQAEALEQLAKDAGL